MLARLYDIKLGMAEVTSSMLTPSNTLLLNFLFSHTKASHANIVNSVRS